MSGQTVAVVGDGVDAGEAVAADVAAGVAVATGDGAAGV